jgi:hypothetical protein
MQRRAIPAWFAPLVERRVVAGAKAESLAEALFSLDEPWRGRFLELVASLATRQAGGKRQPTWQEVTAWLGTRPALYQRVKLLLSVWCKSAGGWS